MFCKLQLEDGEGRVECGSSWFVFSMIGNFLYNPFNHSSNIATMWNLWKFANRIFDQRYIRNHSLIGNLNSLIYSLTGFGWYISYTRRYERISQRSKVHFSNLW